MSRGTKRLALFVALAGALAIAILNSGTGDESGTGGLTSAPQDRDVAGPETALMGTTPALELTPQSEQRTVVPPTARDDQPLVPVEIEHAERDLLVRVVDPGGRLLSGVPVSLFVEHPDGRSLAIPKEFRVSGHGAKLMAFGSDDKPDAAMEGVAIWSANKGLLRNLWGAFDGKTREGIPELEVGIALPSEPGEARSASRRVVLDFANWPQHGVRLEADARTVALLEPLRVEVHFASGESAPDVPVGLFGIPFNPEFGQLGEFGQATSGPDGVALIPRVQQLQIVTFLGLLAGGEAQPGDLFEFHVAATFPISLAPRVEVPAVFGPDQSVRLDLPPIGRLRATFVDFRGAPYGSEGANVQYRINWTAAAQPPRNRPERKTLGALVYQATVDLGWVGLDMEFDARAWAGDGGAPGADFSRIGPLVAGEEVELRFEFGTPFTRLEWQVLGADGEPVANETLDYSVYGEPRQSQHVLPVESDASGRVRWIMRSTLDPLPRWFRLERKLGDAATWGIVELPLRAPEPSIPHDSSDPPVVAMGTIQLGNEPFPEFLRTPWQPEQPEPLLADGHVFDTSGVPIVGVTIYASARQHLARAETDKQGRFELRTDEPEEFRLRLWHDDHVGKSTDLIQPGSRGLVFELDPAGGLFCKLIGSNELLGDTVSVHATCEGVRREADRKRGGLEVRGLPAGQATVVLKTDETGHELARFENVTIELGEISADPRLAAIELESIARAQWFRFEGAGGKPITARRVRIDIAGHGTKSIKLHGRSRKWLLLPRTAETAVFSAEGYGTTEVPLGSENVVVRFAGGGQ